MIIFLSDLQKEHLSLVHDHSVQVLVDFCKLAIDYINNGNNEKKYIIAAEKLDVTLIEIQKLVHAIVYLIVEACKHNLSEADFKSSLAIAGFSADKQEVLLKLYTAKRPDLSDALCVLHQKDPSYQDLQWRLEVQLASRSKSEEIKPTVLMDFVLTTPKNFTNAEETVQTTDEENITSVKTIISSIPNAKTASQCQNVVSHVLLQCDLKNLVHITNNLEQAVKESKSQHVRKVQRVLQ